MFSIKVRYSLGLCIEVMLLVIFIIFLGCIFFFSKVTEKPKINLNKVVTPSISLEQ